MSAPPLGILCALPRRFSTASCPPLPPPTKEKDAAERVRKTRQGVKRTPSGSKKQGGKGFKKQGQRSEKPGVRKTGVQGLKKHAGVKKHGQGSKKHWAHLINKVHIYFIFSIGGLGFLKSEDIRMNWGSDFFLEDIRMNWKIYEWIVVQIFFWRGKYTNELEDIRMNWGSDFFGRYTNELEDIRMNCGSDFFLEK